MNRNNLLIKVAILGAVLSFSTYSLAEEDPELAKFHYKRGCKFMEKSDYEKAIEELKRGKAVLPSQPLFWYKLGICYEKMGKENEAVKHFMQFLNMTKSVKEANMREYHSYAKSRVMLLDTQIKKKSEAAKKYSEELVKIAKEYRRLQKSEKAAEVLRKALEVYPANKEARIQLSSIASIHLEKAPEKDIFEGMDLGNELLLMEELGELSGDEIGGVEEFLKGINTFEALNLLM